MSAHEFLINKYGSEITSGFFFISYILENFYEMPVFIKDLYFDLSEEFKCSEECIKNSISYYKDKVGYKGKPKAFIIEIFYEYEKLIKKL